MLRRRLMRRGEGVGDFDRWLFRERLARLGVGAGLGAGWSDEMIPCIHE